MSDLDKRTEHLPNVFQHVDSMGVPSSQHGTTPRHARVCGSVMKATQTRIALPPTPSPGL